MNGMKLSRLNKVLLPTIANRETIVIKQEDPIAIGEMLNASVLCLRHTMPLMEPQIPHVSDRFRLKPFLDLAKHRKSSHHIVVWRGSITRDKRIRIVINDQILSVVRSEFGVMLERQMQ